MIQYRGGDLALRNKYSITTVCNRGDTILCHSGLQMREARPRVTSVFQGLVGGMSILTSESCQFVLTCTEN